MRDFSFPGTRNRRTAHTIVELMVAAAIATAVLLGIYFLVSTIGRDAGRSDKEVRVARELMLFMEQVQHDLRRAVRFVRDGDTYIESKVRGFQPSPVGGRIPPDSKAGVDFEAAVEEADADDDAEAEPDA